MSDLDSGVTQEQYFVLSPFKTEDDSTDRHGRTSEILEVKVLEDHVRVNLRKF